FSLLCGNSSPTTLLYGWTVLVLPLVLQLKENMNLHGQPPPDFSTKHEPPSPQSDTPSLEHSVSPDHESNTPLAPQLLRPFLPPRSHVLTFPDAPPEVVALRARLIGCLKSRVHEPDWQLLLQQT